MDLVSFFLFLRVLTSLNSVAVTATPSTRIFSPATHVAETSRGAVRDAPWPYFADAIENSTFKGYQNEWPTDNSYLGNHQLGDMFLRIPDDVYTPYIAHTDMDGYVLVHGHPLNGTKFFTWGDSGPGRFMQVRKIVEKIISCIVGFPCRRRKETW